MTPDTRIATPAAVHPGTTGDTPNYTNITPTLSAHVPGSIPPAFSRSAFSWSGVIDRLRAGEHVGIVEIRT